jgi:hypothetical protein
MNEFYIKVKISSDEITEATCFGRKNNHDCWNTWIGDWTKIADAKNIKDCKSKLRDYLISQDKGLKTIESIISKIQVKT